MSSCAASCSIYFHAASSASATSASLPTDNVPGCCHSASAYFGVQKPSQLQQHRLQRTVLTHPGIALCAAQGCMSSNGSPQLNSCSVLRPSTSTPHESTAPTSIPPRVRTRTQILRLTWLKPLCGPSFSLLSPAQNNARLERPAATSTYATHKVKRGDHPPRLSSIESP
jgi:hypothetical protein